MVTYPSADDVSEATKRMLYDRLDNRLRTEPVDDAIRAVVLDIVEDPEWEYETDPDALVDAAYEQASTVIEGRRDSDGLELAGEIRGRGE